MQLPGIYQPSNRLSFLKEIITSKNDIRNILLLQTSLLANDKYEVAERKPAVGFDSGENFIQKEALAQVLSCEFCEIFKNTFSQSTSG